jgi:thiol:disulfide interchange protein
MKMHETRIATILVVAAVFVLFRQQVWAQPANDPFSLSVSADLEDGRTLVTVSFSVQAGTYLYADQIEVRERHVPLAPYSVPVPKKKYDQILETETTVYAHDVDLSYVVGEPVPALLSLIVRYQGCDETQCFLPVTREFSLSTSQSVAAVSAVPVHDIDTAPATQELNKDAISAHFIVATEVGYLTSEKLLGFLDSAEQQNRQKDSLAVRLKNSGPILRIMLILLFGFGLNMTPCVLPMIPINLAIIGAGAQAGTRLRGFALGAAYGLGMSVAYGVLGLSALLAKTTFGTLQSQPWFNFGIAALFLVLSLGMFGLISLDFSRFQTRTASAPKTGRFMTVLFMGVVSALLAGACVAPILIAVLLLTADLYARGNAFALLLPFLLGCGMALPWPLAGAGLSFLPKPGKWMDRVKYAFGVLILVFAAYYAHLGYDRLRQEMAGKKALHAEVGAGPERQESITSIPEALALAQDEGRPVFIDFWASWCKNCVAMEKTTFRDPDVVARLKKYILVAYQAEDPDEPDVRSAMDLFDIWGLPTYVVLIPKE